MTVAGVIIAGGTGARMGGCEKLLMPLDDGLLIDRLIPLAQPQVDALAINVRAASMPLYRPWLDCGIAFIHDGSPVPIGPLGGVIAGLEWMAGLGGTYDWLATFPGDGPFLPADLVQRLLAAAQSAPSPRPAVVHDGQRLQNLFALWPRGCLDALRAAVENGAVRSVHRALEQLQYTPVMFDDQELFLNINTPGDLERAKGLAKPR
jgi:molybdopterin-guanine dinucleotide biosynthesis protein A